LLKEAAERQIRAFGNHHKTVVLPLVLTAGRQLTGRGQFR
jgi:hypothetical protein